MITYDARLSPELGLQLLRLRRLVAWFVVGHGERDALDLPAFGADADRLKCLQAHAVDGNGG